LRSMTDLIPSLSVAVVVFVSTNVDDVLLLAAFFADPCLSPRAVVAGQFLGIGALVAASAAAALAALVIPAAYVALLGIIPLGLGLWEIRALRLPDAAELQEAERRVERRTHSQAMAVAGVTVANGGDNLGVYIPLFARDPALIPFYAVAFAVMTGLLCLAGYRLVRNRVIGMQVRRYGHLMLPIVLIGLGLWILSDAAVFFR
jgi:cadmium resistance protein CadD (predicted permease)